MLFSEHIRLLRKERNVPQRQLATAIGVDVPMYCRYEHGERHPKREQVVKLARLLGADRGELVAEWLAEHALSAIGHDPMSARASELLLQRLGGTPAPAAVPVPVAPAAPDPLADVGRRADPCDIVASMADSRLPHYEQGDAPAVMARIEDASVDCIVTTPPYYDLLAYGTESLRADTPRQYLDLLLAVAAQARRVLKPGGSLWLNVGDASGPDGALLALPQRLVGELADRQGWQLRNHVVWNRMQAASPDAPTALRRTHEALLHFAQPGPCHFDAEAMAAEAANAAERPAPRAGQTRSGVTGERYLKRIRTSAVLTESEKAAAEAALQGVLAQVARGEVDDFRMTLRETPTAVAPTPDADVRTRALYDFGFHIQTFTRQSLALTDLWDLPLPRTDLDHYRLGPDTLYRLPIAATCPRGGLVLDPFCGTGTVCRLAYDMGRRAIGIDINPALLARARRKKEQQQKPLSLF